MDKLNNNISNISPKYIQKWLQALWTIIIITIDENYILNL